MEWIFFLILQIIGKLLKFFFEVITSKVMSMDQYGIFSLFVSLNIVMSRFAMMGIPNVVIREVAGRKIKDSFVKTALLFPILMLPIIAFILVLVSNLLLIDSYTCFGLLIASCLTGFIYIASSFLRVEGYVKLWFSSRDIIPYLLFAFIIIGLYIVYNSLNYRTVVLIYIVSLFLSAIILLFFLQKLVKLRFTLINSINLDNVKKITSSALPVFLSGFTYVLLSRIDIIMLSKFVSLEEVGQYNVIARIAAQVIIPYQVISAYYLPKLASMFNRRTEDAIGKENFKYVVFSFLGVFIFLIVGLFVVRTEAFKKIFPLSYDYIVIYLILGCTQLIYSAIGYYGYILLYIRKEKVEYFVSAIVLILNVLLNLILIPHWGVIGASISTFCAIIIGNIIELLLVYFFRRRLYLLNF